MGVYHFVTVSRSLLVLQLRVEAARLTRVRNLSRKRWKRTDLQMQLVPWKIWRLLNLHQPMHQRLGRRLALSIRMHPRLKGRLSLPHHQQVQRNIQRKFKEKFKEQFKESSNRFANCWSNCSSNRWSNCKKEENKFKRGRKSCGSSINQQSIVVISSVWMLHY